MLTLDAEGATTPKPNIVLILTDDMEAALVEHMPRVRSLIADQGATFTRAYVNTPLCCPSRATILTGRYAQNTKVTRNNHRLFHENGNAERTVAVWLKAAGYRTGLVGKYLNAYPNPMPAAYVPPGWDAWVARAGGKGLYYDYELNQNGRIVSYGQGASDYSTDVYAREALAFVNRALADEAPFLLQLSPHAPHGPQQPAPRHAGLLAELEAPRPPALDEADVSDKPAYIRDLALVTDLRRRGRHLWKGDEVFRDRVRSLQAVDEAVGAVVDALAAAGRLDETYLVFTSDNGWLEGEHRLRAKGLPYEEVVRIPLLVRGPGIKPGLVLEHLVGNVDLAPTFAEWAGAAAPGDLDGRSLAALLVDGAPGPEAWRQAFPLAYEKTAAEMPQPSWRGVRTRDHAYVEYATGERELYDTRVDPHQLDNLATSTDPALLRRLARLTAALKACKGAACRRLEDAPSPATVPRLPRDGHVADSCPAVEPRCPALGSLP